MVVADVLGPVVETLSSASEGSEKDRASSGAVPSPADLEALAMVRKGFEDLAGGNPVLAWKLVEGLLGGINECVAPCPSLSRSAQPDPTRPTDG